ncbi:MAG: endonuclease III [Aquificaceae bacterium]|nr:endonuclease III [Aquificaceae bacterium]
MSKAQNQLDEIFITLKELYPKLNAPIVKLLAYKNKDPFKTLICALLSTRTKDQTTAKVCEKLLKLIHTPKDILKLTQEELSKLIYPVAFYKNKSAQLIEIAQTLETSFGGLVPESLEELLKLKGVGRKVANLVLAEGFSKPALCVDVHVHRISNRLGIISTKTPYQTELELSRLYPAESWIELARYLVAFGQSICKPVKPLCETCPLNHLCLSARALKTPKPTSQTQKSRH